MMKKQSKDDSGKNTGTREKDSFGENAGTREKDSFGENAGTREKDSFGESTGTQKKDSSGASTGTVRKKKRRTNPEVPILRKLRIKFLCVCMALITALLGIMVYAAVISARQNLESMSRNVLERAIREQPGHKGPAVGAGKVVLPYFVVDLWDDGTAYVTGGTYDGLENTDTLSAILTECLAQKQHTGVLNAYGLRYLYRDNSWYIRIAFVDMSVEIAMLRGVFVSWFLIALAALGPLLAVSVLLSYRAVAPVEKAWKQQRQFLSDASHELKTPLAVILSNAELLEQALSAAPDTFPSSKADTLSVPPDTLPSAKADALSVPPDTLPSAKADALSVPPDTLQSAKLTVPQDSAPYPPSENDASERVLRWAGNIHAEARRMKNLVEQMLTLARADHASPDIILHEVSLSDTAADCALAFEPVAFEAGKPLCYDIAAQVCVTGDGEKLYRLVSILLDNAVKYGADGGTITLTLEKSERHAKLTVANPGTPIPSEQLSHLFERFYRADASRGIQSGFGLGLSIAATIAREHKGTLRAESDENSTRFLFSMPLKRA